MRKGVINVTDIDPMPHRCSPPVVNVILLTAATRIPFVVTEVIECPQILWHATTAMVDVQRPRRVRIAHKWVRLDIDDDDGDDDDADDDGGDDDDGDDDDD